MPFISKVFTRIVVISRYPGGEWGYRNLFPGDNAAAQASAKCEAAYDALRRHAENVKSRWQTAEPHSDFRVLDLEVDRMPVDRASPTPTIA